MNKKTCSVRALRSALYAGLTALLLSGRVFAIDPTEPASGGFASSDLATGTANLLSDVSGWLIGIGLTVGTLAAVYFLIRKSMADEVDGKMWNKRLVTAIICAVAVALVGGIISLISSYYGG